MMVHFWMLQKNRRESGGLGAPPLNTKKKRETQESGHRREPKDFARRLDFGWVPLLGAMAFSPGTFAYAPRRPSLDIQNQLKSIHILS